MIIEKILYQNSEFFDQDSLRLLGLETVKFRHQFFGKIISFLNFSFLVHNQALPDVILNAIVVQMCCCLLFRFFYLLLFFPFKCLCNIELNCLYSPIFSMTSDKKATLHETSQYLPTNFKKISTVLIGYSDWPPSGWMRSLFMK